MTTRRDRLEATRLYLIVSVRGDDAWQAPVAAALASGCIGMVQLRDVGSGAAPPGEDATRRRAEWLRSLCATHDALLGSITQ